MQIQVSTDNHTRGSEELIGQVEAEVESGLRRFAEQITRVEVHFSDENAAKTAGDDKRCRMEVRLAGAQPIVVTADAPSLDAALDGATGKMKRQLETILGRLGNRKGRTSHGGDQTI